MIKRDRRSDIMRAAEKLFTSRRYHEISLDDIVEEAKVGKGTIYRYFKDKDDVFLQTASSGFEELRVLLTRQMPGEASFSDQLIGACRDVGGFFHRRRQLFRMMQAEDGRMYWRRGEVRQLWMSHHQQLVAAVAGILRKGVDEGHVRRDVSPEVLAAFLLGMLRARVHMPVETPEELRSFELVVELFLHGVSPNEVSAVLASDDGQRER